MDPTRIPGSVMARFACTPNLECQHVEGPLPDLLECDSKELLGKGWCRFSLKENRPNIDALTRDLKAGRAARYLFRAMSRSGDLLLLNTLVFVSLSTGTIRGVNLLESLTPTKTTIQIAPGDWAKTGYMRKEEA
jgi:hypothetical protein